MSHTYPALTTLWGVKYGSLIQITVHLKNELRLKRLVNRSLSTALVSSLAAMFFSAFSYMLKENNFEQTIPPVKVGEEEDVTYEAANITLKRALRFFSAMQTKDGHWAAENAGPLFFVPPLVMCLYITGHLDETFSPEHKKEILRYNEDGGWGFHIEGHSIMFCTVLSYICMRILGDGPFGGRNNAVERGRKWIHDHGGVVAIPSWGKTWLSGASPCHQSSGSCLLIFLCIQQKCGATVG
ncbi:unnamed protein product [Camellia sinensis]